MQEPITSRKPVRTKTLGFRVLVFAAAVAWVAADLAVAQGKAGSSRSSSPRSSSASSSSSSGSSSSSSASSSGRSVVSRSSSRSSSARRGSARSGSEVRRGSGAARTRTGQRPQARRGHRGHRYGGYYGGYYGLPYYWSPWGYWGWGLTFGHGYGAYGYGHHYPPVVYSNRPGYRMGALDLAVRPKSTEVYVDGQYVGLAKQYDGFPGHLWLEKGVYEVSFYRPGFETQTRTVKVLTDLILDIEIDMQEGVAEKPEMRLSPEDYENDVMDRGGMERSSDAELGKWRRRGSRGDYQARLHVDIEPEQALVYLDGNVLGTGSELAGLHAGLILSAGTHTLEVVHRGFVTVERSIVVEPGEEVEFALTLQPSEDSASP